MMILVRIKVMNDGKNGTIISPIATRAALIMRAFFLPIKSVMAPVGISTTTETRRATA